MTTRKDFEICRDMVRGACRNLAPEFRAIFSEQGWQVVLQALELAAREPYYYLATPYSKYPHGIEAAFELACRAAADLVRAGVRVYSPIAHTHPVAIHGGIDPYDHRIWLPADAPFMAAAKGLIVLRAEGWETSYGISEEIKAFAAAGKPIVYMDPGAVPVEISEVR